MSRSIEKLRKPDKLTSVHKLDQEIRRTLKGTGTKKKGTAKVESQGPIDWSHQGIKSKYRGEHEREHTWHTWMQSVNLSKTLLEDVHKVLPVVRVERHPIYAKYHQLLEDENATSNTRTRSRLLMKRFVLDVQEIWLTNLQHLHEHKPENIAAGDVDDDYDRGDGIAHRRDTKAILALDHQVRNLIS